MTIAFEFAFESHMQDHVASIARQYVRGIISSVQRVALALSPSHLGLQASIRSPLGTPEAHTLSRWICQSYRYLLYNIILVCLFDFAIYDFTVKMFWAAFKAKICTENATDLDKH